MQQVSVEGVHGDRYPAAVGGEPPQRAGLREMRVHDLGAKAAEEARDEARFEAMSDKQIARAIQTVNGVGQVKSAEIVSHKHTQKSKGFAFVTMNTVDEARRAVTELHDKEFMGRKLVVSGAKTSDVPATRASDDNF